MDSISSTMHWGTTWNVNGYGLTHGVKKLDPSKKRTFNDDFHVFGVYWNASVLYTYLDTPSQVVCIQ